jgi:biotin-(acetyl-CoA carboxylase) ligase
MSKFSNWAQTTAGILTLGGILTSMATTLVGVGAWWTATVMTQEKHDAATERVVTQLSVKQAKQIELLAEKVEEAAEDAAEANINAMVPRMMDAMDSRCLYLSKDLPITSNHNERIADMVKQYKERYDVQLDPDECNDEGTWGRD